MYHDGSPSRGTPHGFGDDERSLLLRRRPPEHALRWVERELGALVTRVRALKGGSSSGIHALRVVSATATETVVMRRWILDWVNEEEPDIAEREARVLALLETCDVGTPRLLAVDPTGASAGAPTMLMSRVPGRVDWSPLEIEPWLRGLAAQLPAIHATEPAVEARVQPFMPYAPASWAPPPWMRHPRLWERAVELFHGPPLDPDTVLVHRDYHPGNVLWARGRVSGVVDWASASVGPRAVDVFYCRTNLLARFGGEVADRFIGVWEAVSGETHNPAIEAVMLVDAMGWSVGTVPTEPQRDYLENLLARRLAEFGA